ncbi:MAG TPA: DEAD/DEAH box helicase, partial [Cryomorphaceae bacterium]|nr:DEAD/DEAH box helicase [Cryomorphaceae bacterium]
MNTFFESGLKPEILRALDDLGFETPTPVQVATLNLLSEPAGDLIALAQTGTGKTAAFGLPLLHRLDPGDKRTTALILCPTRELSNQITNDLRSFSTHMDKLFVTAIYGGAPISNQIRFLEKGVQVVVGTPGRVVDVIRRGALKLDHVKWFILDEADEMLNMGFKDDLETIFREMPEEKSVSLFSATMPPKV